MSRPACNREGRILPEFARALPGLFQGLNFLGCLLVLAQRPILHEFFPVFDSPLDGEVQSTFWQITNDDLQCPNVDLGFVFCIHRVKVGWRMLTLEHLDDDAKKLADGWHKRKGA